MFAKHAMRGWSLALVLAVLTVVVAAVFVAYALSGADLCLWCPSGGR